MWGEGLRGLYCWGIDWRSDILAGCTQASLVNKPYWWINPRYGCKAGGGGGGGVEGWWWWRERGGGGWQKGRIPSH